MQVKANEKVYEEKSTTMSDYDEMKRRIYSFMDKWDKILSIDVYIETNGQIPTKEELSFEIGVSVEIASVYLQYHATKDAIKKKDLEELLMDFNVYNGM